jgi:hypothetical protein
MYKKAKNLTMKQFLQKEDFYIQTKNLQTRQLSGGGLPDLQTAKENMEKYFSVVGITEMYDESLFLMGQEYGWSNFDTNYKMKHVNSNRPVNEGLPEEVYEIIQKNNQLDKALYAFAKAELHKKISSLDHAAKQKLDNFLAD